MSQTSNGKSTVRRVLLKTAAGIAAGATLPRATAQARKRPVTIWSHFGGANFEIFNRYVAEFNQANPDIEVKTTSYGPSEILPKYLASVAAGAPPDIFHAPGYVPPDLALNKVIIPVDEMRGFGSIPRSRSWRVLRSPNPNHRPTKSKMPMRAHAPRCRASPAARVASAMTSRQSRSSARRAMSTGARPARAAPR